MYMSNKLWIMFILYFYYINQSFWHIVNSQKSEFLNIANYKHLYNFYNFN